MSTAPASPAHVYSDSDLEPAPRCPACGVTGGTSAIEGVEDYAFGNVAGRWSFRRCTGCGTLRLDPRPTRAAIGHAYRDYSTHAEPLELLAAQGARRRAALCRELERAWGYELPGGGGAHAGRTLATRAAFLVRHLPRPAGRARLLDVGCGNGEWLLFMRSLGWEVEGLELDAAAAARARGAGLEVGQGTPEEAEFPPGSFDAITLGHLLEHLHQPALVLERCRTWLAHDGVLWLATPNAEAASLRLYGRFSRLLEAPRHLQLFSARGLGQLLEERGYTALRPPYGVRSSRWFLRVSAELRRHGRPGRLPWAARRAVALRARLVDWRVRRRPELAEELVLVARKSAAGASRASPLRAQ